MTQSTSPFPGDCVPCPTSTSSTPPPRVNTSPGYLSLIRPDAHEKARGVLGDNPYMLQVLAWLQVNISVWASGTFHLSYGGVPGKSDGRAFVQARVSKSPVGLTINQLLAMPAGNVRLGGPTGPGESTSGSALAPRNQTFAPFQVSPSEERFGDKGTNLPGPLEPPAAPVRPLNLSQTHFPNVRLFGIHGWLYSLTSAENQLFHAYLYGFRLDRQDPLPALYEQYVSVRKLEVVYDACTASSRSDFIERVRSFGGSHDGAGEDGTIPDHLGAVQVPLNLPDPIRHPVILVGGLQDWFSTLGREENAVFLKYLFNHDVNWDYAPTAEMFRQPVSNYRLAATYDMSHQSARRSFEALVQWRGLYDEPRYPDGYCYLVAFAPAQHDEAKKLGELPTIKEILAAGESLGWSENKLELTMVRPGFAHMNIVADGKPAFAVFHTSGFDHGVRVGAATADLQNLVTTGQTSLASTKPTVFDDKPGVSGLSLTLPMFVRLDKKKPDMDRTTFSVVSVPAFAIMLGLYESIRLDHAEFKLSLTGGTTSSGWMAITQSGQPAPAGDGWFTAPHILVLNGSDGGAVSDKFILPAAHGFSRELRGVALGNAPPVFHFAYTGNVEGDLIVMGKVVVTVAGQVPLGAFNVSPSKPKLASLAKQLIASVSHPIELCSPPTVEEEEDSDDDEEDDDPPPRTSPVRPPRSS